ncbi:MAG: NUDIX domain-containing protein [Halobacteriaceae archaeon]
MGGCQEAWPLAARREVREETGVDVTVERPLVIYGGVCEHEADRFRGPYSVKYLAMPVDDTTLASDPGVSDEEIEAVDWFGSPPERMHNPKALRETFAAVDDID